MNNYDLLSDAYEKTHEKPDKKFSMLPTALSILNPLKNKIVIDVGCGDGFFTKEFSKEAKSVIGIDNSKEQILKSRKNSGPNIKYLLADMNEYNYSGSDIIFAPFVLNYLESSDNLQKLFNKFYKGLSPNGMIAGIMDFPKKLVHDSKKFGIIKKIKKLEDGEKMDIELYNEEKHLVTLHSFYHTKKTVEKLLKNSGFANIVWHKSIVSEKGKKIMGQEFWKGYVEDCDLEYFTASKL